MSKLEDLINKLCPEGVEHKTLNEVTKWDKRFNNINNNFYKSFNHVSAAKLKDLKNDNGTVKLLSTGNFDGVALKEDAMEYLNNDEIFTIPSGGAANIKYFKGEFVDSGNIIGTSLNSDLYNTKYIYYFLENNNEIIQSFFRGSGVKHPDMSAILNIKIPVPPLEVQCEIVHILDRFTLLTAELTAELKARQKQYEYYMDQLFKINENSKKVKLMDVLLSLKTGLNPRKFFELNTQDADGYYVTVRELGNRNVKYWESKDRVNQFGLNRINERSNLEINDVLFSGTGTIGRVSLIEEKPINWNVKEGVYILKPNSDLINPVFLMYLMKSNYMKNIYSNYIVGSPVVSVPMKDLKNVEFCLPTMEQQEKIVNILDRFETICNDLSLGLPAEIEKRQKQYEYYRDKLLSFKVVEVNE